MTNAQFLYGNLEVEKKPDFWLHRKSIRAYDLWKVLCTRFIISNSSINTPNVLHIHFSSPLSLISAETSGEHNEAVISVHHPRLTRATPALLYNEASETQPAKSDQALKSVISAYAEPQSGVQKENRSNQKRRDGSMRRTVSLRLYRNFTLHPRSTWLVININCTEGRSEILRLYL